MGTQHTYVTTERVDLEERKHQCKHRCESCTQCTTRTQRRKRHIQYLYTYIYLYLGTKILCPKVCKYLHFCSLYSVPFVSFQWMAHEFFVLSLEFFVHYLVMKNASFSTRFSNISNAEFGYWLSDCFMMNCKFSSSSKYISHQSIYCMYYAMQNIANNWVWFNDSNLSSALPLIRLNTISSDKLSATNFTKVRDLQISLNF